MTIDNFTQQTEGEGDKIRSFAFVIAAGICVIFSFYFIVSGSDGSRGRYEIRLANQLNPNDAPAMSLARLPGIGAKRAEAIVAYRQDCAKQQDVGPVFQNVEDLQKVKGIGPKTAGEIDRWLKYE